jgi:hypothetical protein
MFTICPPGGMGPGGALKVNCPLLCPAGITRVTGGTVLPGNELSVTLAPPCGAGAERKTHPAVVEVPACITVGVTVTDVTPFANTIKVAVLPVPCAVPDILASTGTSALFR